jgi:hypothetical protein
MAVAAASLVDRQSPFGLGDGETGELLAQSRKHLPMALAATEPDRAADEIEALERAAMPPALLAEARAQTFIRLVNAAAYAAAERLAPGVARQTAALALGDGDGSQGEVSAEALDSLYCLGVLALHRERPDEAAELFERIHRLAQGNAESLWSARLHEGLRLARAHLAAARV